MSEDKKGLPQEAWNIVLESRIAALEKKDKDITKLTNELCTLNTIEIIKRNTERLKELEEKLNNCITHAELEGNLEAFSETINNILIELGSKYNNLESVLRDQKKAIKFLIDIINEAKLMTEEDYEQLGNLCTTWSEEYTSEEMKEIFEEIGKEKKTLKSEEFPDSVKGIFTLGYNKGFKEALGIKKEYRFCGKNYTSLEDYIDARENNAKKEVISNFMKFIDEIINNIDNESNNEKEPSILTLEQMRKIVIDLFDNPDPELLNDLPKIREIIIKNHKLLAKLGDSFKTQLIGDPKKYGLTVKNDYPDWCPGSNECKTNNCNECEWEPIEISLLPEYIFIIFKNEIKKRYSSLECRYIAPDQLVLKIKEDHETVALRTNKDMEEI